METCYVCLETMDIEKLFPYVCHKNIEGEIRYRQCHSRIRLREICLYK